MFKTVNVTGVIDRIIEYGKDDLCPWMECTMVIVTETVPAKINIGGIPIAAVIEKKSKKALRNVVKAHFPLYDPVLVPGTVIEGTGYYSWGDEEDNNDNVLPERAMFPYTGRLKPKSKLIDNGDGIFLGIRRRGLHYVQRRPVNPLDFKTRMFFVENYIVK